MKFFVFIAMSALVVSSVSADIFGDLLGFDLMGALTGGAEEKKAPAKLAVGQREEESDEGSTCTCAGTDGCNCCVDFNLTSIIDLGGPGCVKMRYISQEEGIALNVSYGDSLLHSQVVKKNDKKGSCMNLLSEFAQICAKFAVLKATDDGYEGCLNFEPHVLGEVTTKYHIGCFKMGPDGMVQDEKLADTIKEEKPAESSETEEEGDEDDSSSIFDVVNQGAEQGIAFFTDLLGFKRPGKKNKTTTEKAEEVTEAAETETEESQEESRKFSPARNRLRIQSENLV